MASVKREVIEGDSLPWLRASKGALPAIFTSLPDAGGDELAGVSERDYPAWFQQAAADVMAAAMMHHPVIFLQTDRKYRGGLIDKAGLLYDASRMAGLRVVFHKIILRRDAGKSDLFRPGYSHLICFGSFKVTSGKATPDVFPAGDLSWRNGSSFAAMRFACEFLKRYSRRVFDPFCGGGDFLAMANALGMDAFGRDIDPDFCQAAREVQIELGN
jgi:hypothetical protein